MRSQAVINQEILKGTIKFKKLQEAIEYYVNTWSVPLYQKVAIRGRKPIDQFKSVVEPKGVTYYCRPLTDDEKEQRGEPTDTLIAVCYPVSEKLFVKRSGTYWTRFFRVTKIPYCDQDGKKILLRLEVDRREITIDERWSLKEAIEQLEQ